MIVIQPSPSTSDTSRPPLNKRELERFLSEAKKAIPLRGTISVLLTGDGAVRELNRRFRRKNKATDVLSFPAWNADGPAESRLAGDLAISLDTAARQAENFGHSLRIEVQVLMLHGLLHLAGLDHETDDGEMANREQELRKRFGLPLGLIQRSATGAEPPAARKTPRPRSRTL